MRSQELVPARPGPWFLGASHSRGHRGDTAGCPHWLCFLTTPLLPPLLRPEQAQGELLRWPGGSQKLGQGHPAGEGPRLYRSEWLGLGPEPSLHSGCPPTQGGTIHIRSFSEGQALPSANPRAALSPATTKCGGPSITTTSPPHHSSARKGFPGHGPFLKPKPGGHIPIFHLPGLGPPGDW